MRKHVMQQTESWLNYQELARLSSLRVELTDAWNRQMHQSYMCCLIYCTLVEHMR